MKQDSNVITSAVDDSLDFVGNHLKGLIHTVYAVPDYMVDGTRQTDTSDWCYWKPLKAEVSATDLDSYENHTGINLPASYKAFLINTNNVVRQAKSLNLTTT